MGRNFQKSSRILNLIFLEFSDLLHNNLPNFECFLEILDLKIWFFYPYTLPIFANIFNFILITVSHLFRWNDCEDSSTSSTINSFLFWNFLPLRHHFFSFYFFSFCIWLNPHPNIFKNQFLDLWVLFIRKNFYLKNILFWLSFHLWFNFHDFNHSFSFVDYRLKKIN